MVQQLYMGYDVFMVLQYILKRQLSGNNWNVWLKFLGEVMY